MPIKICLPIIKNCQEDVLETIRANMTKFSCFELWLDYVDDLNEQFVKELEKVLGEKLILVFRRQNLQKMRLPLEKRLHIISALNNSHALIDLDVETQKEELDFIKQKQLKVKTIVSHHNYEETPTDEKLKKIVKEIGAWQPTIIKVATMCQSKNDAIRLLQLLLELKEKQMRCIILGMGQEGVITRIFGTLWGNEVVFAPEKIAEQSAPGQLERSKLEMILQNLGGGSKATER